jgi:bacterioferritin
MLRDPKVIEHLNNELTVVNQYFLHARTLEHWGTKLGNRNIPHPLTR